MSTPATPTVPTALPEPTTASKEVKPKRIMTEAQLLSLSAARQKAMEKRTMIKDINDREKSVKQQELQKRIETLANNEKVLTQRKVVKPKKAPVNYSSSESDYSSESSVEEIQSTARGKPVKKTAKKSSPAARVNTTKLTNEVARGELQRRIHEDNYKVAFQSLFPGYHQYS